MSSQPIFLSFAALNQLNNRTISPAPSADDFIYTPKLAFYLRLFLCHHRASTRISEIDFVINNSI